MANSLIRILLIAALALSLSPAAALAAESPPDSQSEVWYPQDDAGHTEVAFYFVFSETCGHCAKAKPFIADLEAKYDWLQITRVSTQDATQEQIDTVMALADEVEEDIVGVPTYLYCERMDVGFDSVDTTGADIEGRLLACYASLDGTAAATDGEPDTSAVDTTEDDDDLARAGARGYRR